MSFAYNQAVRRCKDHFEELIADASTPEEVAVLKQNCEDDLNNLVDYFID